VPGASFAAVDPARIAKGQVLHALCQGRVCHLKRQMQVIAHQAEPVNPIVETYCTFLQQQIQATAVFVAQKYRLATVTA
jgi:hypothetical protein